MGHSNHIGFGGKNMNSTGRERSCGRRGLVHRADWDSHIEEPNHHFLRALKTESHCFPRVGVARVSLGIVEGPHAFNSRSGAQIQWIFQDG